METNGKIAEIGDPTGAVARTVDQATTGAHKAIDKASDAARPAVDRLATGAHQAVDKIAGAATQAAETLDLKSEQLMDAQTRLTESCREYVRDNPVTSLGIAVAAGFLLSRLLSSR
jgi:ElaB/YqjD/DUF883 family membrane-anchored ribosome-binding protein